MRGFGRSVPGVAGTPRTPYIWWRRTTAQTIPNAVWTAVQWTEPTSDPFDIYDAANPADISMARPYLWNTVCCLAWARNVTGIRSARFVTAPQAAFGGARLGLTQEDRPALATPGAEPQRMTISMQPGGGGPGDDDHYQVHVFQNSGGPLDLVFDGLQAPIVMSYLASLQ